MKILVTGGTGSFATNFIRYILAHAKDQVETIRIYSRDEHKQTQLLGEYGGIRGEQNGNVMRGFIGDIRDLPRLRMAMEGVDVVVHAAALKQVQSCEYNPLETIKTNVLGAENVVQAALDAGVGRVLAISTDKAVAPLNLYGATKLCMERLFTQANAYRGSKPTKFACTRYGNVADSRGTVVHIWRKAIEEGLPIKVTHPDATRYWITMEEANRFVWECLELMDDFPGGEIFVPRLPSVRVRDLAQALAPDYKYEIIGERVGDKLHEDIILKEELRHTNFNKGRYIVLPEDPSWPYLHTPSDFRVTSAEDMNSGTNNWFLTPAEIQASLSGQAPVHQPAGAA